MIKKKKYEDTLPDFEVKWKFLFASTATKLFQTIYTELQTIHNKITQTRISAQQIE